MTLALERYRAALDAADERRSKRLLSELVVECMPLVESIARRTLGSRAGIRANVEEAVNEGCIGLVRAIETYREDRGAFVTWAGFWTRHHVQECMQRQRDLSCSRATLMPASVHRRANVFRARHGREPSAEDLGIDPGTWARWERNANVVAFSVDATPTELRDDRPDPEEMAGRDDLVRALESMPARDRALVRALFVEERTLTDVARELGVSVQRVHQLKLALEKRLRLLLCVEDALLKKSA